MTSSLVYITYLDTKNVKSSKASRQVGCYEFKKDQASFENDKEMFKRALELSRLTIPKLTNVFNIKSFKDLYSKIKQFTDHRVILFVTDNGMVLKVALVSERLIFLAK